MVMVLVLFSLVFGIKKQAHFSRLKSIVLQKIIELGLNNLESVMRVRIFEIFIEVEAVYVKY